MVMGKKNSGGKKFKSNKKSSSATPQRMSAAAIAEINPDNENTFAGIVVKAYGDCKFGVRTPQHIEYKVGLPGSLKKGKRTQIADMVFFEISALSQGINGYILHVYTDHELSELDIPVLSVDDDMVKCSKDVIFTNKGEDDEDEYFDFDTI